MVMHKDNRMNNKDEPDANRDPITGTPGAHPVSVGTGAAAGGVAGAAIGSVGGPIGAGVGAAVGAVAGGLIGKGAGEALNPTVEDEYWRENYIAREYVERDADYEEYQPAYRMGWEASSTYSPQGQSFEDVAANLEREWPARRGSSKLDWGRAKPAVRDAWQRTEQSQPARAGRDRC